MIGYCQTSMTRVLFIAISSLALVGLQREPESKVTFIRNGQVYIWTTLDRKPQQLTSDPSVKRMPRWSPDGSRIVYWDADDAKGSLGNLVVLRSDGVIVGRLPVAAVTPAGIRIEGMHGVEQIGWADDADVFAQGNINPYADEYRVLNIDSREMHSFGGFGFATCALRGITAFWKPVFPNDDTMVLADSRETGPLFEIKEARDLPTLNVPLTWDGGCDSIGFIDPRPPLRLVVISIRERKSQTKAVPQTLTDIHLEAAPDGFLIGPGSLLRYSVGTNKLEVTSEDLLTTLRKRHRGRRDAEKQLQASDSDWWPAQLTN